ncbi:MAG: hypothetical protein IKY01_02590 [Prevotella sp.]|nr:hypothetical protein [Prevotella sp.]
MTEEKLNALRQQDMNLRDAIRQDEMERPQMPADLNARLMQRVATKEEKKPRRIIWPWIAAACVAGVMMIWLTPPKTNKPTDVVAENKPAVEQPAIDNKEDDTTIAKVETEAKVPVSAPTKVKKVPTTIAKRDAVLLAQETPAVETPATPTVEEVNDLAVAETAKPKAQPVTLTERDIPVTRPENYQYTPEELALMKKQANEAYLKWVELELEISKCNLEQTAQK